MFCYSVSCLKVPDEWWLWLLLFFFFSDIVDLYSLLFSLCAVLSAWSAVLWKRFSARRAWRFFRRPSPSDHLSVSRLWPVSSQIFRFIHWAAWSKVSLNLFKADSTQKSKIITTSCIWHWESSVSIASRKSFVCSRFRFRVVTFSLLFTFSNVFTVILGWLLMLDNNGIWLDSTRAPTSKFMFSFEMRSTKTIQ